MKSRLAFVCLTLLVGACRNAPPEPKSEERNTSSQKAGGQLEADPGKAPRDAVDGAPGARADQKVGPPPQVTDPIKWNYPSLAWTTNEAGRNRMKESGRPGMVVLQGDWCPHCRSLATAFADPEIERLAGSFELILIDSDTPEATSYEHTGQYVPRTLFLRPDGSIDKSLTAPDSRFPHFFSIRDKAALTDAMKTAISRYGS